MAEGDGSSSRTGLILSAALIALIAALFGIYTLNRPQPDAPETLTAPQTAATGEAPAPEAAAPDAVPDAALAEQAATAPETPAEPAPLDPPTFDAVRVTADGEAQVAGRTIPGGVITVLIDDTDITQAQANARGDFVAFFTVPEPDQPHVVTLKVTAPDGREALSAEPVYLLPAPTPEMVASATPEETPAPEASAASADDAGTAQAAAPEASMDATDGTADASAASADAPAQAAASTGGAAETPWDAPAAAEAADSGTETLVLRVPDVGAAPLAPGGPAAVAEEPPAAEVAPRAPGVLVAGSGGVRLLQPALPQSIPEAVNNIVLDSISYDEEGAVAVSGRAAVGSFVRVYVDNEPVQVSRIGDDGSWRVDLPQIDSGVYRLRIDEVDASGAVKSRVETPFKREEPAVLAQAAQTAAERGQKGVTLVTVQPGSTLWGIANANYGSGFQYVRIFEANRDQIRDPDLIYPGQIFTVPDADAAN